MLELLTNEYFMIQSITLMMIHDNTGIMRSNSQLFRIMNTKFPAGTGRTFIECIYLYKYHYHVTNFNLRRNNVWYILN